MRRLILSVLLATSVAMPAMAQDRDGRQRDRGERSASSAQRDEARAARRAERAERPQRVERERPQAVEREARSEVREQAVVQRRDRRDERRGDWGQRRSNNDGLTAAIERQQTARAIAERQSAEQRRDYRRDGRRDGSVIDRAIERARTGDRDAHSGSRYSRDHRRWSNHWRGDRNYDWRNYRHRNRSIFRLGNYFDPYGSSYRRFSIGFSLFPSYYQSSFWLNDPWTYRLPPAYGPYRWVRYYDDALLVNVYTGQVVDVEYNVFW